MKVTSMVGHIPTPRGQKSNPDLSVDRTMGVFLHPQCQIFFGEAAQGSIEGSETQEYCFTEETGREEVATKQVTGHGVAASSETPLYHV